jgi:WD40 repeat protein
MIKEKSRFIHKKEIVLKRRNFLFKTLGALFVLGPTFCLSFPEIGKINPTPGMSTWTIASDLGSVSDATVPLLLFNSDVSSGVLIINAAGNYALAEDLTECTVVISSDRVSLDLRKHKITSVVATDPILVINGNSQIRIFNGTLQGVSAGSTGYGIHVLAGASKIVLKDLTVYGCAKGVYLDGVSLSEVTGCTISDVNFIANDTGLFAEFTDSSVIKNCNALYSNVCGFELLNGQANCFYDCNTLKTTGTGTVAGFKSTLGTSNMFQRCVVKQTKTSSITFGDKACGFLLTSTEQKTKIVDCIVNETDVVSSRTAVTFGIELAPIIQPTADLLSTVTLWTNQASSAYGCAWSPNNDYVAVTFRSTSSLVSVYKFDGTTLALVTSVTPAAQAAGVAWSPDGRYLAVGAGQYPGADPSIYIYSFNGQTLTSAATFNGAGGIVYSLAWSPNGKYLAYADCAATGYIDVLSFDGSSISLLNYLTFTNSVGVSIYVSWAPDGSAIGVSQNYNAQPLRVIPVNASGQMGTAVTLATSAQWSGMKWSPNGRYFATCDTTNSTLRVYRWNPTEVSPIAPVASIADAGGSYNAVTWSPDGNYIVASTSNFTLRLYQFSGTSLTFIKASPALNATINMLSWSADGRYIVACSQTGASQYIILTAMYGPLNCLIDNCRVCDILASNMNMGRGLVMGGTNVCTRTVACNSGVNYSYGITNVYDGRFEIARSVVQPFDNVSMPTTL